jgi:hypothetical protein
MERWIDDVLLPILVRKSAGSMDDALDLYKAASNINAFAFTDDFSYNNLWATLRGDKPQRCDLLLDITQEYITRMGGMKSSAMKALLTGFSESLMYTVHPDGYQDETARQRAIPAGSDAAEKWPKEVEKNMWFVVYVLISWLDIAVLIKTLKEYSNVQRANPPPATATA